MYRAIGYLGLESKVIKYLGLKRLRLKYRLIGLLEFGLAEV